MVELFEKHILLDELALHFQRLTPENLKNEATLVFLHDALGSISQWKSFPEEVVTKCGMQGIIIERQGHGKSWPLEKKRTKNYLHEEAFITLPAIFEKLQVKQPVLIGHSDGGSIALLYASRHETKAVVTIAAHVMVEEHTLRGIRETLEEGELLKLKLMKYHGAKTTALFDAWWQTWLSEDFANWSFVDELHKINCPILAIQSDNDEFGSMAHVEQIVEHAKGQSLIIDGGGHAPHLVHPEGIAEKICRFLGGNE